MKKQTPAPTSVTPSDPEDGSEKDYVAHNAYRNIVDAETHKSDPHLMNRVRKVAERHINAGQSIMRSVQDIKDYAKKKHVTPKRYEKLGN
jgi:hypothetical protein